MNPILEFEEVVTTTCFSFLGDDNDLAPEIVQAVLNWMGRNQIVFYQP